MMGRYKVLMNGVPLDSIDESIIITDIQEHTPELHESVIEMAGMGSYYKKPERVSLSITVKFVIREYDIERRKMLYRKVAMWADKGWLEINDRPGQRLNVVCVQRPVVNSSLRWTGELGVTFSAFRFPYWESVQAVKVKASAGTSTIAVTSDLPCLLSADVKVTGGTLNTLTIETETAKMMVTSASLASGQTLSIGYTDEKFLTIKAGDKSLYRNLDPSSDDVLKVPAGASKVKITADATVSVELKAKGVFE